MHGVLVVADRSDRCALRWAILFNQRRQEMRWLALTVAAALLVCVLVLSHTDAQESQSTPAPRSAIKAPPIGAKCIVRFEEFQNPNRRTSLRSGTLVDIDTHWVVVETEGGSRNWFPREKIVNLLFPNEESD